MQQIGPYTVLDEIARGGHGVVYRAQDRHGQVVALKLLLAHRAQNEQARKRFQAEVNALTRLRHPHVVPILAAGEHEGCPWLALDYVEGESLETRLLRSPLKIYEAIRVAQQLAQALSYVHSCGVLHRDLKPDNVLLRGNRALLTDFGLVLDADASASRITAMGVFQGTPGYWAPEQAQGQTDQHGEHTDVYGLGAVLYASLTGSAPVQAGSLQEHLQTTRFRQVPSPRKVRADVPSWLSDLCMRCLAVNPAQRPASAEELARDLVLVGGGHEAPEPVELARRGGLAATAALVMLVLGVGAWVLVGSTKRPEPNAVPAPDPNQLQARAEVHVEFAEAARIQGRFEDALAAFDQALLIDPENRPAELGRAHSLRELRRFAEAMQAYSAVLAQDPEDATTTQLRGECWVMLGRYAEAIEDFDRALELDPRYALAYANRGSSKADLKRSAEAIEDYDKAIELDPGYIEAYVNRGTSKLNLGRFTEAIEDYDKALELDPRYAFGYRNRGACKAQLGRYAEAIADYDKALEIDPRNSACYAQRGVSKTNQGRYAEAIEDYDRALEIDPRDAFAYSNRGFSKARLQRHAEAIEDFDKALEIDPRDAFAYSNRGGSKIRLGRNAEAIEDYDRALEIDPRDAEAYANRGGGKASLGRYAEAIEDYDRALEIGVDAAAVDRVRQRRAEAVAKLNGN